MLNVMQEMGEVQLPTDIWLKETFLTTVPAYCLTKYSSNISKLMGNG